MAGRPSRVSIDSIKTPDSHASRSHFSEESRNPILYPLDTTRPIDARFSRKHFPELMPSTKIQRPKIII